MKLAIVTSFPPSKVTLNEYAYHLAKSFSNHQEVTELILLTDFTPEQKDLNFTTNGCTITVKECWKFNSIQNIFTVTKAINATQPDAILFNLQFMKFGDRKVAAALGLCLPYICKLKKIPTIVLLHNILEQVDLESAGFTSNKVLQKIYNLIGTTLTKLVLKADLVAVTMDKYVATLKAKYDCKNVLMIPHGTFEVAQKPTYELPDGPLKVMTFGKFGTYKKVEALIESVEILRKKSKLDIEIVIAGTDNPNVPGYLEQVKNNYQHVPQLTFTGYVKEEEVPTIFNESAVVVFPYTSTTGSSGVLHQAGSFGKAVAMPNLGDLKTLIEDEGYRGEYFETENAASMASALEAILTNVAYRKELEKANYKAATAYPMSVIADMYINEFKEIMMSNQKLVEQLNS